jgi:hypothetical protein
VWVQFRFESGVTVLEVHYFIKGGNKDENANWSLGSSLHAPRFLPGAFGARETGGTRNRQSGRSPDSN